MNVNLYKIDEGRLNNNDIASYLSSEEYVNDLSFISSSEDSDDLNVGVWIESRERESTDWQNEVQRLIRENEKENKNIKIFEDLGCLYNVVIIVECQNDIYALPFGHAYNTVVKVCDREFGMNIASRQIKKSDVNSENVNKFFSNVIAQQTYYSQSTEISIDYFESYEGITGKPKNEVFGRAITCSQSVRFNTSRLEDVIVKVIPKIPHILEEEETFEIPRVNRIPKNDDLSKKLHLHLLDRISKNKSTVEIPDNFFINNHQYSIYDINQVYVESKKRESAKENDYKESWQEIAAKLMKEYQVSLDKIKFVYEYHDKKRNKSLSDIARIDLSYENEQYMLVDGYWCEFNQVYLEFVNEEVDKINYKLNEFLYKEDIQTLKGTDLPEKYSYNNVELNGLEDRIIAYYAQDPKYQPFHRKLIKPIKDGAPFGRGNELCDLAFQDHEERYLVSTKVSMDTDPFLKCIDQSLYSLNILRNPESFELDGIGDYLNPDYIALHIVLRKNYVSNRTKELKNDSHIKKVEKEQFKFSNLRSDLLKSKLLEWRTQVHELGLKPIVFVDVLDMENQRLFETA